MKHNHMKKYFSGDDLNWHILFCHQIEKSDNLLLLINRLQVRLSNKINTFFSKYEPVVAVVEE